MSVNGGTSAGAILELVRSGRVRTRREVQDLTGISRSTLALRMTQLQEAGYLLETGQIAGTTGRPARILSFDESGQLVLAVDLGATHAHLAVIDGAGLVLAEASSEIKIDRGPDEVLRGVVKRLFELLARSGRDVGSVAGIGIGIPGPVRFSTRRPNQPPLMPGWHDYPVAERLAEAFGVPAFVDNDANLMGLGEMRERYPASPSVLFVKVGTGIGAGVILRGEPERGIAGGAGDIGHIRMGGQYTRLCTCGAVGCIATEASGSAIIRELAEAGIPASTTSDITRLLAAGDPTAIRLVTRAGHLLGEVLATSVALLNPEVLIVGGAIAAAGDHFLQAVRERIFERTVPLATRELIIAASALGPDAAVHGARHMVIGQTFSADAVDERIAAPQPGRAAD